MSVKVYQNDELLETHLFGFVGTCIRLECLFLHLYLDFSVLKWMIGKWCRKKAKNTIAWYIYIIILYIYIYVCVCVCVCETMSFGCKGNRLQTLATIQFLGAPHRRFRLSSAAPDRRAMGCGATKPGAVVPAVPAWEKVVTTKPGADGDAGRNVRGQNYGCVIL